MGRKVIIIVFCILSVSVLYSWWVPFANKKNHFSGPFLSFHPPEPLNFRHDKAPELNDQKPQSNPEPTQQTIEIKRTSFGLWADFIYWQPIQTFMDVGYKAPYAILNNGCGGCGVSYKNGEIIGITSSYKPGFKVGALYALPSNLMDIFADYTYLRANSSVSSSSNPQGFLYARWIAPSLISNNSVSHLNARWHLNFNVINLEIGKHLELDTHFVLTPHAGLASALINQKLRGEFTLSSPECIIEVTDMSRSWSIGPRIGMKGQWKIVPAFSILANIGTDILYTQYDLSLDQGGFNDPSLFLTSKNKINTIRPELDLYLGLSTGNRNITFEAGYDFQVWWNQNMMRWYSDYTYVSIPQGDLYFQGLRLTLRSDF